MQQHLDTLTQELKAAAEKFCEATGKRFEAEFSFIEMTAMESRSPEYQVYQVKVTSEESSYY